MSLKENDKSLLSDPFLYQMGDDSHLYDATEKVLILRKTVQDKVYLYVFHYYILYVKAVFQWRPYRGGSHLPSDITSSQKLSAYTNEIHTSIPAYVHPEFIFG